MSLRNRIASASLCTALSVVPLVARAQALGDPLAQSLKSQGDSALDTGHFAEALDAYTRATAIEDSPILAYNRGRALQALQRHAEALDALEAFRERASSELLARVPKLDQLLAQVRAHVSTLKLSGALPAATSIRLDKRVLSLEIASSGVHVEAGAATLTIESDGFLPFRKRLDLTAEGVVEVPVRLVRRDESALLRVSSPVTSARVFVDDELVSQTPAELRLAPTAHSVRVEHAGYEPSTLRLVLAPHEARTLDVPLSAHAPITSQWWFWTGVATVAVATTVVVVALSTERAPGSGSIAPGTASAPLLRF